MEENTHTLFSLCDAININFHAILCVLIIIDEYKALAISCNANVY